MLATTTTTTNFKEEDIKKQFYLNLCWLKSLPSVSAKTKTKKKITKEFIEQLITEIEFILKDNCQ